jgi:hypothetical protein
MSFKILVTAENVGDLRKWHFAATEMEDFRRKLNN